MPRLKWVQLLTVCVVVAISGFSPETGQTTPKHGIAMYGEPLLPPDFVSLPYARSDAPKGGVIVFGETGGFDSLNPYILKGRAPWGIRSHVYETLLGRNWAESFSLYGLLAESVETGENRDWVEFVIRPQARFSSGDPVTVEDVLWSFRVLAEKGLPRYRNSAAKIKLAEQTGPRSVRFTFDGGDMELPLILGWRPILRKADWEGRDFSESSLELPNGTGPYLVDRFEPNRYISFKRNPDYWGRDLPLNRGVHNFDEIRYEYFNDGSVTFQAFTAGEITAFREFSAQKWQENYDIPAVVSGDIVKSIIPHQRPSGMSGFVFNTRKPQFRDWRVRDALIHAFNFEFVNLAENKGELPRATSYFSNSELGMRSGPATGKVLALLEPYEDDLPAGALAGYTLPQSDGSERNRKNLRHARKQLKAAGWTVQDGVLKNQSGQPFAFEFMLRAGAKEGIANIYSDALKRLGITPEIKSVDSAQYLARRAAYDFDVIYHSWSLSLSPGNEQSLYWGSQGVEIKGTRNYMGVNSDAIDRLIENLVSSENHDDFVAATRALDRVLTAGRYVVPFWFSDVSRLAHKKQMKHAKTLPIYGDWIGFLPDVWWWDASE